VIVRKRSVDVRHIETVTSGHRSGFQSTALDALIDVENADPSPLDSGFSAQHVLSRYDSIHSIYYHMESEVRCGEYRSPFYSVRLLLPARA
jgi:hypothetical protein